MNNNWGLNIQNKEEIGNGYWIETENHNKYYITKDLNNSTNVVTWIKGSGSTGEDINLGHFKELIADGTIENENVIYAFPYNYEDTMNDNFILGSSNDEINQILSAEHISVNNRSAISHSGGGSRTLNYVATNIKENGISSPQTIVLEDPRIGATGEAKLSYTEETVNVLAQNKATVVSFHSEANIGSTFDRQYQELSNNGIRIFAIVTGTGDHGGLREYSAERGAFSLATGNTSTLKNINDKIYTYENGSKIQIKYENGKWINIDTGNTVESVGNYILTENGEIVNKNYTYTVGEDYIFEANFLDFKDKFNNLDFKISSDLDFLTASVNRIKSSIQGTSALNVSQNPSLESTTRVPIQATEIIYNYLSVVSTYLDKLTKEIQSTLNIGQVVDNQDKELEKDANDLTEEPIQTEQPNTSEKTSEPTPSKVISPVIPSQENNGTTNTNNSNSKGNTQTETNQNMSNNQQPEVNQNNNQPPLEEETTSNTDFPKYEEIYSNDNQIVYNYNDECKLIIHHEGDQITGIEYYYDLGSKETAFNMFDEINNKYSGMEGFKEVIQNDRYIKVVLNNDYVNKFNINDIKDKFSNLEEITKGGINNG